MVNYRQKTRMNFKCVCSSDKYQFEPRLKVSDVHEEIKKIKKSFKIGDKKLSEFLEQYRTDNGEFYRNPLIWEAFEFIGKLFDINIAPPVGINTSEELQRKYGYRPEEISYYIEMRHKRKIPAQVITSWIKKYYSGNIKEGSGGYFYLSY